MLVANKQDLASERQVTLDEAVNFAKRLKLAGVVETSAKDGLDSVDDCFFIPLVNAFDRRLQDKSFRVTRQDTRYNEVTN